MGVRWKEEGPGAEKVLRETKNVPQRLKPHCEQGLCSTAEAVPLSKTTFAAWLALVCCGVGLAQPVQKREVKPGSGLRYEITGVVVNSVNGSPVAKCHVA